MWFFIWQELFVDTSRDTKIRININVVFPFVPCHSLSIDAMDISGVFIFVPLLAICGHVFKYGRTGTGVTVNPLTSDSTWFRTVNVVGP